MIAQHAVFITVKVTAYSVINIGYFYVLNLNNLDKNTFNLLMKILLIYFSDG